ncbi:MAG: hypothetical protein JNL94_09850 [Planctomycetes bacterium]|nr:hypothetical protein [Planctomycetota bacterium]
MTELDVVINKALDGLTLRHKAIATNLANASTPGFKRFEVLFEDQLESVAEGGTFDPDVKRDSSAGGPDGNNVVPESELSSLTRVEMSYQILTRALSFKASWMRAALSGRSG